METGLMVRVGLALQPAAHRVLAPESTLFAMRTPDHVFHVARLLQPVALRYAGPFDNGRRRDVRAHEDHGELWALGSRKQRWEDALFVGFNDRHIEVACFEQSLSL